MIVVTATLDGMTQTINGGDQRITGSITQEVGAIWSFSFDITPNNAGFDLIRSRRTIIKAINTTTGRVEFAGRVLLAAEKMETTGSVKKSVTCESFLGYLQDSIQPYAPEELYTLNDFIDFVLSNHNARVEESKHIFRGKVNVDVADTGNVYKGLQYETTFQTLKSKLVDVYGGEMEIEEIDGVLYLNYLQQIGTTRTTKIKVGRNMQAASREVSPLNIVTRIIPLGAKLKEESTDESGATTTTETNERLTLAGYTPAGGEPLTVPWLDDTEKIAELGIICGVLDCSDITEQSNLYARAKEHLTKENRVDLTHTLTALDLKENGQEIDGLYCGDSYPVENELIGLNEVLRITKRTVDVNASYKGSITIGEKKTTFSKLQATTTEKINAELKILQGVTQMLENATGFVSSQVATLSTTLTQTISEIVATALASYVSSSDMETIKEEISTEITTKAGSITTEFTNSITKLKTEVNGTISSEFTELKAYIRYYMNDAGQPVIELGKIGENEGGIICRLLNDKLSFMENGVEVAYISDSQLFITDATILNRLNIGNMSFLRRRNGNLSLVMNGG